MNNHIGKDLGQFDLKRVWSKICFLAPKLYAGSYINDKNEEVTKIKAKGIIRPNETNLTLDDFISLLKKDSDLILEQEKMYKDFSNAQINIKKDTYKIMSNSNKRIPIYSEDNVFIGTKPFTIKEDQIINREKESIDTK